MLVNGWIQVNPGIYFYFDENGECVSDGWKKINNVWYYFKDSVMINQDTIIDGQLYRFSSNGACGWGKCREDGI